MRLLEGIGHSTMRKIEVPSLSKMLIINAEVTYDTLKWNTRLRYMHQVTKNRINTLFLTMCSPICDYFYGRYILRKWWLKLNLPDNRISWSMKEESFTTYCPIKHNRQRNINPNIFNIDCQRALNYRRNFTCMYS